MKEEITAFVFYKSFYEAIEKMPSVEDKCIIYQSICNYCFYDIEPNLSGVTEIIWTLIKPQIDANIKKRIDGRRGGAPKGNTNAKKQPKTTIVDLENNHWLNKKQPNVNDNANVNANDKANDKEKAKENEIQVIFSDKFSQFLY